MSNLFATDPKLTDLGGEEFQLIQAWLSLLILKTGLTLYPFNYFQDRRLPKVEFSGIIDSRKLYLFAAFLKAFLEDAKIAEDVLGSLYVLEAESHFAGAVKFDYKDNHAASTIMVRIGDVAVICCLDDYCGTINMVSDYFRQISPIGSLNEVQLTEVFCHITCASIQMRKPEFVISTGPDGKDLSIACRRYGDRLEFEPFNPRIKGELMLMYMKDALPAICPPGMTFDAMLQRFWEGQVTFLESRPTAEVEALSDREIVRRKKVVEKHLLALRLQGTRADKR